MISYVFENGVYSAELSDETLLPKNMKIEITTQQFLLHVPKNMTIATPIRLKFINEEPVAQIFKVVIVVDQNSEATLIEEYVGTGSNITTEIFTEKNARLHFYKKQNETMAASHSANVFIQQKQDSSVKSFFADFGGGTVTRHVQVNLAEKGASCYLRGIYFLNQDKQLLTQSIHIDHAAEHGNSEMNFKGILNKKSRANFKGKVYVHPHAQKINAQQSNHNLLLSNDAIAEAKPELEIYADDVKCSHGATVGQLDQDALFYLRARGLEHQEAVKLLTQAFAFDVINKIENAAILQQIQDQMSQLGESV
jgi:Fe-S cluster assembly protein SufD